MERAGTPTDGHPAGAPGATGVWLSSRERMFNGWAAAIGEKRIDLSGRIAWFCDILNIGGSFVEIGPRSVIRNSAVGVRKVVQRGRFLWRA